MVWGRRRKKKKKRRREIKKEGVKTRKEQINFDILNEISVNIGVQEHWNMLENVIISR